MRNVPWEQNSNTGWRRGLKKSWNCVQRDDGALVPKVMRTGPRTEAGGHRDSVPS